MTINKTNAVAAHIRDNYHYEDTDPLDVVETVYFKRPSDIPSDFDYDGFTPQPGMWWLYDDQVSEFVVVRDGKVKSLYCSA